MRKTQKATFNADSAIVIRIKPSRGLRSLDEVSNVHGHLLDLGAVELLDLTEHANIVGGDEVDGNTLTTETTTTTDTVNVVLAVGGKVVVDDQGNLLDIDT